MTPPTERPTIGELSRRLERMEDESTRGFASLHRRLDELNYVRPEMFAAQMELINVQRAEIERRLALLEVANSEREKETAANRRMALTGIVFPIFTAVMAALILAAIYGRN